VFHVHTADKNSFLERDCSPTWQAPSADVSANVFLVCELHFKSWNEYNIHHYVQRNSGYQYIIMHVTDKTLFAMTTTSKAQADPMPWHKCAQLYIH